MIEVWRDIPGFAGRYRVSNYGRVMAIDWPARRVSKNGNEFTVILRSKIFNPGIRENGYLVVSMMTDGKASSYYVHRLVMLAFVGQCPDGMETCHNDGERTNNRLDNLRYDTPAANQADRYLHGTQSSRPKKVA